MRRLIIGSNGEISSYFCKFLTSSGRYYLTLNSSISNSTDIPYLLNDSKLIDFIDNEFDVLYLFASSLIPGSSYEDYLREVSDLGEPFEKLLSGFKKAKHIVFISSGGCVYKKGFHLNHEDDPTFSYNNYGQFKIGMENIIQKSSKENKFITYTIIRPSNIYGTYSGRTNAQGIINNLIHSIKSRSSFEIWNNGEAIRDYVYITDFVNVLIELEREQSYNQIYNVGTGVGTSVRELISLFSNHLDTSQIINITGSMQDISADVNILDIRKLRNHISYHPISLHNGISRVIDEYINI
ncbi:NAD-dependent epimerase/dehydratase family protein [Planktomarina temperata]|nr:NAD-dependent epimerase/dehydratase family protein [Planktomarina temperata]